MMILNAHFGEQWHSAETTEEVSGLTAEMVAALRYYDPAGMFRDPGDDALLCFADERFTHSLRETYGRKGHLVFAVNKATGYGAFMWYWSAKDPVWVSDNPQPPDFDPWVVSDPGYPLFYSPSSTLPMEQFLEVLEEFCYSGTGDRPASVRWVRGDPCGRRMDGGYYDRVEITSDRFAGEGVSRGMIGYVIAAPPGRGFWVEVMNPDGFTATKITAETRDLRLLTRGSVGIWPFLYARSLAGCSGPRVPRTPRGSVPSAGESSRARGTPGLVGSRRRSGISCRSWAGLSTLGVQPLPGEEPSVDVSGLMVAYWERRGIAPQERSFDSSWIRAP